LLDAQASNRWFSFEKYMYFFNLAQGLFGVKRDDLNLETPKLQEVFIEKLPQFSISHMP
jgi:hypothetical protein